jgi:protocatechuate 3,4-dioxygenase beta subunit
MNLRTQSIRDSVVLSILENEPLRRLAFVFLMFTAVFYAQAPQSGPQNGKGTISGAVTRVATGTPILRATVTLTRINAPVNPLGPGGQAPAPPPQVQMQQPLNITVQTDAEGKFQFNDVDAGSYRLSAARNGYARQEYGQRALNRPGTILNLRAGQQLTDVAFKLTPAATISGRVMDSNGEPLTGVTVQALRSTFDATGKRTLQATSSARTNDLGEYRLYWINPGRYFVGANAAKSGLDLLSAEVSRSAGGASPEQAQAAAAAASIFGSGSNPNEVADTGFSMTFYPGTTDATRSVALDLQPGQEIRAIDFTLARQQRVKLSGRVIDADSGKPPQMATVTVSPRDTTGATTSSPLDVFIGMDPSGARYNSQTGEFTIQNVASGSYWLQVIAPRQSALQAAGGAGGAPPANPADAINMLASINSARMSIDVGTNDVDNITLSVTSGVGVPGRIRVEGTPASGNGLAGITVSLQGTGGVSILSMLSGGGQRPAADGSFTIPRITAGEYRLVVNGLNNALYIKSARLGALDVLQPGFTLTPPINGTLEITLGVNPGQVTGVVLDAALKPVSGVQAVLIPDQNRSRQDLYKTALTDPEGRFTIRGVTPGDYRLFAWEDIEPFSYFDTAIMRQYEQQGKLVRIQEGSSESTDLRIIPAGAP